MPQDLSILDQLDITHVRTVVWALGLAYASQPQGIATHGDSVSHGHAHVLFGFVVGDHDNAEGADRHTDVGDVHAPERPGCGAPARRVSELAVDVLCRRQHDPQRQAHAQGHCSRPMASQNRQSASQCHGNQGGGAQLFAQLGDAVTFPAGKGAHHHEQQDRHHDWHKDGVEVGRADRQLAQVQRIDDQRIQGSQQHGGGRGGHQNVVEQQEGFT